MALCRTPKPFLWLALVCVTINLATAQLSSPLHGTVNIILANSQGIVVETDSQLSDTNGQPVGLGQKLFRVDDHTVCTIADFYSDPGPRFSGNNQFPTNTRVPMMIANTCGKGMAEWGIHLMPS